MKPCSHGCPSRGATSGFDDVAGWRAYRDHPEHRRVIDEHIQPVLAERAALQFEI